MGNWIILVLWTMPVTIIRLSCPIKETNSEAMKMMN